MQAADLLRIMREGTPEEQEAARTAVRRAAAEQILTGLAEKCGVSLTRDGDKVNLAGAPEQLLAMLREYAKDQ